MSAALATRDAVAIVSVERACELLAGCRSADEIRHISALAQAVATAKRGTEAGIDAAEIVLRAKARIGELTAALEKTPPEEKGKRAHQLVPAGNKLTKATRLEAEGISRKEAAQAETIFAMQKDGQLDAYVAQERAAHKPPTVAGAIRTRGAALPRRPRARRADNGAAARVPGWEAEAWLIEQVRPQIRRWREEWLQHKGDLSGLIRELQSCVRQLEDYANGDR